MTSTATQPGPSGPSFFQAPGGSGGGYVPGGGTSGGGSSGGTIVGKAPQQAQGPSSAQAPPPVADPGVPELIGDGEEGNAVRSAGRISDVEEIGLLNRFYGTVTSRDSIEGQVLSNGLISLSYLDEGGWDSFAPVFIGYLDPTSGLVYRPVKEGPNKDLHGWMHSDSTRVATYAEVENEVFGWGMTTSNWSEWFKQHENGPARFSKDKSSLIGGS